MDRRGEREAVSTNSLRSKLPITAWTARLVGGGAVKEENDADQEERG